MIVAMIDANATIAVIAANIAMRAAAIVVVIGTVIGAIVNSAGAIVVTTTGTGIRACCSASRTER